MADKNRDQYVREPDGAHCAGQPARLKRYVNRRPGRPAFVSTAATNLWSGAREASFYGACILCGAHPQSKTDPVLLDGKAVGIWMGHIDDPTRQIAFVCEDCMTVDDLADTNHVLSALEIDPDDTMDWWTSKPLGRPTSRSSSS